MHIGTKSNPYLSPIGGRTRPTEVSHANDVGLVRGAQTALTPWVTAGPWIQWPWG